MRLVEVAIIRFLGALVCAGKLVGTVPCVPRMRRERRCVWLYAVVPDTCNTWVVVWDPVCAGTCQDFVAVAFSLLDGNRDERDL